MAGRRDKRARKVRRAEAARPSYVGRRRTVLGAFAVAAAALVWGAVERQIFEKDFLQTKGDHVYLDTVKMPAQRGIITDRHGAVLAVSTPVESIAANPRVLRPDSATLQLLAGALQLDADDLRRRLARYGDRRFVYLKRRIAPEQADAVRELIAAGRIDGLHLEREYRRYYPAGEVFAHVVGFTDVDDSGQEGLELAYDSALAGAAGSKRVLRDGRRRVVDDVESIRMPVPGRHLALSIDRRLQFIAYRELLAATKKHRAKGGSAVLLDVRTGEVLAMVNQPAFNPNKDRSNKRGQLRNRALTDVYEPGSTMKPFTVAAALDLGALRADARIDTSPGLFHVGRLPVRDERDLGLIDLPTLLRKSSNVGAAKIALELPREALWAYLSKLGFGATAGTGFPGESSGQFMAPESWARIDQATLAFGYGLSSTTLQLARAYAALAGDGVVRPVSLLRVDAAPAGERVFSAATARAVRGMLETVVAEGGTAPAAAVAGYRVAGKTGTVKKIGKEGYSADRHLALFAGMAPASDPRLVMVVVLDEPGGDAYYGGAVAAPVFAAVMDDALRILNLPPDDLPERQLRVVQAGAPR